MGIYPPSKDSDIMYHIVVIFRENYKVTYVVDSEPSYKATSLCVCLLLYLSLCLCLPTPPQPTPPLFFFPSSSANRWYKPVLKLPAWI